MARHRGLLVALLVYVSLDLSIAAMPGAFVFEPGDSVESAHRRCEDAAGAALARAEPVSVHCAPVPHVHATGEVAVVTRVRPRARFVGIRLPRARLTSPVPSEDPH
jgi:hypothetical protein